MSSTGDPAASTAPGRPAVSVVMPFAGTVAEAGVALRTLTNLQTTAADELILADNSGTAAGGGGAVQIVAAGGERSPSRARNAGARAARRDWILFLDADCDAPADLLDRYFATPVAEGVGALAGAVVPAPGAGGLAARYGEARSFLDQGAHLSHPFMPRAVAANLLVRREAFTAIGGFFEGVRAAEDTDFSWRLQRAGWRLEGREGAAVAHRYRATIGDLRRQWRGYAAGRAWLGRRYDGFAPQPAFVRAGGRLALRLRRRRRRGGESPGPVASAPGPASGGRVARGELLAVDVMLGFEELAGFLLSNRPAGAHHRRAAVVLVADRFPAPGDPLSELARTLTGARVEASARPEAIDTPTAEALTIDYREDDGAAARVLALAALLWRHPVRCVRDMLGHREDRPGLAALAPAVRRLQGDADARVMALGGDSARELAARLGRLAGRPVERR